METEKREDITALVKEAALGDPQPLKIAGRSFYSRLLLGSGKYSSTSTMLQAIKSSATEIVTVALRRVELNRSLRGQAPISSIDPEKVLFLPNTSGARNAAEALRLARLARQLGGGDWVKLEVTPEPRYLLPDPVETLRAAKILVKEGFHVLPYMHADPVLALRLQDVGCATVMPLGSPIGSNQGIHTSESIRIIIEQVEIPVVVDAGLGMPSHAALAMEMGADAILVNTAIAVSQNVSKTAQAFALAALAGREGYLYGARRAKGSPHDRWLPAEASSPLTGHLSS